MDVTLPPELEKLIEEKVRSGQYASQEAVVQAALELFRRHEAAEDRREALLDQGEPDTGGIELTTELRSDIERRALAALRSKKPC